MFKRKLTISGLQISKRWKLLSIEQQQNEMEAKRKSKEEAREKAKKAAGNRICLDFSSTQFKRTCLIVFQCSAEERKIVKVSYQESLQNVPTVRQQAAVSHLHSCHIISFVPLQDGAPYTVCSTFAAPVGEKDELKH